MSKVISAGHICLDITPVFPVRGTDGIRGLSDVLIPGRLINTEAADVHTGGSVANTGLALKKLGCSVTLMGKIGDDAFGAVIQSILAGYGAGGLLIDKGSSTSYTVVIAVPGVDRVFLHNPGANDTFTSSDIPDAELDGAAFFHFGYPPLMRKMYEDGGAELVSMFRRVRECGVATGLDLAAVDPNSPAGRAEWGKILKGALPFVDFFMPSFEELCFMLDRPRYERLAASGRDMTEGLDVRAEAAPLAEIVMGMGCRALLIKCGKSGMYFRTADRRAMESVGRGLSLDAGAWADIEVIQPCYKPDAVLSGTGAGDSSIAAFIAAMLAGKPPRECVSLAAAEGACCVTAYDALSGLKTLPELEARIRAGWEREDMAV